MYFRAVVVLLLTSGNLLLAAPELFAAIRDGNQREVERLLGSGADVNSRNALNATALMQAALHSPLPVMKVLLDKKAEVNATNTAGATALMWAAGNYEKVRLLLDYGAAPNLKSATGRTALIVASAYPGNVATIQLLIKKGADPKLVDAGGDGPLGNAATAGDAAMMKVLLDAGANVHERGMRGPAMRDLTPLMRAAASECLSCVQMLIAAGADVNAVSADARQAKAGLQSLGRLTALIMAAQLGNKPIIEALLDAGAKVNVADVRGFTPLLAAVASDEQNPGPVQLLLSRGADAKLVTNAGESLLDWAVKWGQDSPIARLVSEKGATLKSTPVSYKIERPAKERTPSEAVTKSIQLLQKSSAEFFKIGGCVACHHQTGLAILTGEAAAHGIPYDAAVAAEQLRGVVTVGQAFRESTLLRVPPGGAPMNNAMLLLALNAQRHPADGLTDGLVHELAGLQRPGGYWESMNPRPPMEYSKFSETAFSIRAIRLYGSKGRAEEWNQRIHRATNWLLTAKPSSTEDVALQLLGLFWAGAKRSELNVPTAKLQSLQKPDGGWSQHASFSTDAYATGQALYALIQAGMISTTDKGIQKGIRYLLSTQAEDGSWHVPSRSMKFQPYFESGFPYGHDQWISAMATSWAALALSSSVPVHQAAALVDLNRR